MRVIKYGLVVLLTMVGAGFLYQWYASYVDSIEHPAPGRLIKVDEKHFHIDCRGKGEVTLVLEARLGMDSTGWSLIHDPLSERARVCAYDRAGMGWSEPISRISLAPDISKRLKRLLDEAG